MDFFAVLLLACGVYLVSSVPPPQVLDADADKDISEINKGLNLHEGDIKTDQTVQRSAILGNNYRWNGYIPYVLNSSLNLNYKGIIFRAFEELRLKGCIDFKPWTTETDYVSVESLNGCWSYIGKIGGRQQLSIGTGCGNIGIVDHQLLHCLGFFHEQSRYDRDDYVTIVYENILAGKKSEFDKSSEQISTTQGIPYDYMSVMHFSQREFSNGSGPTILTKDPKFQDVIGQYYGLSPTDALKLSKLYKCNDTISFLDRCSFENNTCRMANCSSTANGWMLASYISGGPFSDHSNLPSIGDPAVYKNSTIADPSSFMHFSTKTGQNGDSGRLETREMTPRRACPVQCLEFFYYHGGNETDQLNIWIREYQNRSDTKGSVRLMDQITGPPTDHWQLRFVPLDASKPFQVEFEARKGIGYSRGGFSMDDINLSETECPHSVWQIKNFMETWNNSALGTVLSSPLYYSPEGYRYQLELQFDETYLSIYLYLVSGVNDDRLQWPCPWRQVTFMLLDQNPDIRKRASQQMSFTTDPTNWFGKFFWGRPSDFGYPAVIDGETVNVNMGLGYSPFMQKAHLGDREFVKGGDLILLFSMQDISSLRQNDSLPCPSVSLKHLNGSKGAPDGPCALRAIQPNSATSTIANRPAQTTSATSTMENRAVHTDTATSRMAFSECSGLLCSRAYILHSSVTFLLALVPLVVN